MLTELSKLQATMSSFIDINIKIRTGRLSEQDKLQGKRLYREIDELVRNIGDHYLSTSWADFERTYSYSTTEPWDHMKSMENRLYTLIRLESAL